MELFPDIFWKNQNKKVNNGTLQEREQAKIVDVRKRNLKLSGKSSSTELDQFVKNLTLVIKFPEPTKLNPIKHSISNNWYIRPATAWYKRKLKF